MNRLREVFASAPPRRGLLPYVTAGYPELAVTLEILRALDPQHCLCAELGIPFSDPVADGPVIQASFAHALAAGFRLDALWEALHAARGALRVPLVTMLSYSIVLRRGPERFVREARAAGVDGLIVPDLALEEAEDLAACARAADCPLVLMVAPNTEAVRRSRIARLSEPFIYYQAVVGITGERAALPTDLAPQVAALRAESGKPVCVGFGISRPAQVAAVCEIADGAIVGSALVRQITRALEEHVPPHAIPARVQQFVAALTAPLSRPGG